jgi:hypothetical protein
VWCVTAIVGAFAARSGLRKWRRHDGPTSDTSHTFQQ